MTRSAAWLVLLLCGCGASGERAQAVVHVRAGALSEALGVYERKPEQTVLLGIAEAILDRDARSADAGVRHAAFSEISMAGDGASALLRQLAEDAPLPVSRALALRGLLQLGHTSVRSDLAELVSHADPEVVDVAMRALDAERDRSALLLALTLPRAARRAAALSVLGKSIDRVLLPVFVDAARRDPEPAQRTAAVYALGSFDDAGLDTLRAALADTAEAVRLAAISVLVRVQGAQSLPALLRYLDAKPSVEAVEAAAALVRAQVAGEQGRGRQVLARALDAEDAGLRARAALVIETLPAHELTAKALSVRLVTEKVAEARLALALALGVIEPNARATLVSLADASSVVAVQAAAALAAAGDGHALEQLRGQLESPSAILRATLARTLGSELARPLEIRSLLADSDAAVQRAAAGAVLRSLD